MLSNSTRDDDDAGVRDAGGVNGIGPSSRTPIPILVCEYWFVYLVPSSVYLIHPSVGAMAHVPIQTEPRQLNRKAVTNYVVLVADNCTMNGRPVFQPLLCMPVTCLLSM